MSQPEIDHLGEQPSEIVPRSLIKRVPSHIKTLPSLKGFAARTRGEFGQTLKSFRERELDVAARIKPGGEVTLFVGTALGIGAAVAGTIYLVRQRRGKGEK